MRRAVMMGLALMALAGCGGNERPPPPARAVVTERFPVSGSDFVATVVPDYTGTQMGELTLAVVETPGVRLAETEYEARVVRILVAPDLPSAERERVRAALAALPGIAGVEPG